jgi:hypothetical protein
LTPEIEAEHHGRGAFHSWGVPRKSFESYVPGALGDDAGNVLTSYGEQVADLILSSINQVPANERGVALQALFETLDPGLTLRIGERMKRGMSARAAIASAVGEGLGKEIVRLGRSSNMKKYAASPPEALSGFWDSVKDIGRKITAVTLAPVSGGASLALWSEGTTSKTIDWGKSTLSKIGSATCTVASSSIAPALGAGAAAASGAPPQVGVVGAQIAGAVCAKPPPPPPPPGVFSGLPSWALPAAVGGSLVVLFLVMRKKSS